MGAEDGNGEPGSPEALAKKIGKIPIRNVWLLFLYAHDLARFRDRAGFEVEQSPDFRSLVAKLLCNATEKRLRRKLSLGYRKQEEVLRRVRGRIDILRSVSGDLFRKGQVACRFEELTVNTPRNRLFRAALERLAGCRLDSDLVQSCRRLSYTLERVGVGGNRPSRTEISSFQFARHEAEDRLMVELAQAALDPVLPTEDAGPHTLFRAQRDETTFHKLFEKAVGKFFDVELPKEDGWRVETGKTLSWPVEPGSPDAVSFLPDMQTDIVLEHEPNQRRIVVDTKFTDILAAERYGKRRFKAPNLYQIYAYLRSQVRADNPLSCRTEGILLYPAIGMDIDETAVIQGHRIRFVTIDLTLPSADVIERLRDIPLKIPPISPSLRDVN